jgi:predicted CXXCH cytochrome family protein
MKKEVKIMLLLLSFAVLFFLTSRPATATVFFDPHGNYEADTSGCAVCHFSHYSTGSPLLTKKKEKNVCYSCHDGSGSIFDVKAAFGEAVEGSSTKASYHPVPTGTMACTDCHSPHLTPAEKPGILSVGDSGISSGNAVCGVCHGSGSLLPGGDMITPITGTPHDAGISGPASGTEIKCVRCHQPHGSPSDMLLQEAVYDEKGIVRNVTGNNNTVCFGCHKYGLRTYNGEYDLTKVKHSSANTSTKAASVYPGTSYSPGMCLNCHEPHGKTGFSHYKRETGNTLCVNCHDAPPANYYSYQGIATYNNAPHASIEGPKGAWYSYTAGSQDFTVWEGLQDQTPDNPGQLVQTSLDPLLTQDSSYLRTDLATQQDDFNTQMYRFVLTKPIVSYSKIIAKWVGYGEPTANHPTQLSIWNYTLNSGLGGWELLQSVQLGTEGIIEVVRTNPGDYINANKEIYLLAAAKHDATDPVMSNIQETQLTASVPHTVRVSWNTNESAKTWIDYGTTSEYGTTLSNWTFKTSHYFDMPNLEQYVVYHYRIRSEDALGNQSVSGDRTFELGDHPAPPTLVDEGDITAGATVTFEWYKVANSTVQYLVQVSNYADFRSIYAQSTWLGDNGSTTQSWSTVISNSGSFYWRVKARYLAYPLSHSTSASDTFSSFASPSCPILYTWNGDKFEYVTDLVAGANVGLELAPGKYLKPAPDDQLAIPGSMLAAKDGYYTIKVKNELNEIDFIDNLILQAIDHPIGTKVALNDFARSSEPYKVYTFSEDVRPVKQATYINNPTYSGGKPTEPVDITDLVNKVDNRHAIGALEDDNQFTFDLGNIRYAEEVKLVVVGWTEFMNQTEREERVEKAKQGINRAANLVEVLQPDGTWKSEKIKHILGHTKTAVIDLTGKFPKDSSEFIVRLRGLYRPHLDFVGVDTTTQAQITAKDLELIDARLEYGGIAQKTIFPSPHYDYYKHHDMIVQHEGRFTRYGDVLPLLEEIDDKLIVMDTGDELTVRYKALPSPEPGMTRSFLLKPYAYYKELGAAVVEPMPFRGMDMSQYPESLGEYPDELKQYVEEWNTRVHPVNAVEQENSSFFDAIKELFNKVVNWLKNLFAKNTEPDTASSSPLSEPVPAVAERTGSLHYSLNANYLNLVVEGTKTQGAAGECVNCHAVHGISGVPNQLVNSEPFLCFGNGVGCHTDPANSASGTMSKANFTSARGPTSRHSIEPAEQAAYGTKVLCSNCHNPHANNAENKVVDPNNVSVIYNWTDRGITNYVNTDGAVYLLARAKHDGTPPVISQISYTVDNAIYEATVTWRTDEVSTRQLEWIVTPIDYPGTVPDAVYNHVYTAGSSTTFWNPAYIHSLKITGMEHGLEYRYRIRAEDRIGNVAYSSGGLFDRVIRLSYPPNAPTNLRHSPNPLPSGNHTENVRLEWDAAIDPQGYDMQYYVVLTSSLGTSYSGWLPVGQTYWNTSVSNYGSVTYSWQVKAKNIYGGEGPYSAWASFSHTGNTQTWSCPVLYTWDGNQYRFVTDIVAGSNVGIEIAQGKYLTPSPGEQITITGKLLAEKDGYYELKVKNELDEIDYIDRLELVAVDHPVGTSIGLNDFVRHKEPYKLFTYNSEVRPVEKATYINNPTYSGGTPSQPVDITELVSKLDNRHAIGTLGNDNQFLLDLGDLTGAEEIKLVITGWTEFMNESERAERVEKGRKGVKTAKNLVEVLQPNGTWLSEDIRHIPGHTKTALIDLTGKFPKDSKKYIVRLRGLYRPHLDFIGVDTTISSSLKERSLKLVSASLAYGGVAERSKFPSPDYNYYKIIDQEIKHKGRFTRFGDVLPLLTETDDKLVVMDTGDELTVRYKALLPPLPGMTRSFVLRPWAYYKELSAATVEPMPFRDMDFSNYPQSLGKYPKELKQYVKEWNTRVHSPSSPNPETGLIGRLKKFLSKLLEWVKSLWGRSDGKQKDGATGSGKPPVLSNHDAVRLSAVIEEELPEHYSLNTNLARVVVATATGNYFNYYPNSAGSEAWESNVMPTFSSPGTPATATQKNNASTEGSSVWSTDLAGADQYNYQLFKFTVSQPLSLINKLGVSWTGYGEPTPNYYTTVYIWNVATQTWQQLLNGVYYQPTTVTLFRNKENTTFCNTCHDNNPPAGVLMGTTPPPNIATSAINDYHGDYKGTKGTLLPPYAIGADRLACDDCHEPHGNNNLYHIREQVNSVGGISLTQTNGQDAKPFCQACHTGDFVTDWHASCNSCHISFSNGDHYHAPTITESLLYNCFRCHGHNGTFISDPGCIDCHGGYTHNYAKTF